MIHGHPDHGASKELTNSLWSWIHRFLQMNHDSSDVGSLILIQITLKEWTLTLLYKLTLSKARKHAYSLSTVP